MILGWNNFIDNASLDMNSEENGYPVDNIKDTQLAKYYKTTGVSGEWIKADMGVSKDVKGIFIAGHNITSGATVKIQANSSDSWITPPVDESLTYGDVIYKIWDSAKSYQYWRITIDDISNGDGYIKIGRVFICDVLDLGDVIGAEFPETVERTDKKRVSITGQIYGDEGHGVKLWTFSLPHITTTEKGNIEDVFEKHGLYNPLFFAFNEDEISTYGVWYGVFNDNISFNHIFKDVWNCNIAFREAK